MPSYWDVAQIHGIEWTNAYILAKRADPRIQVWLNQGPIAPFTCPLLWIPPTPLGTSEEGNPTAIGGGAAGYNPWLCGRVWGLPAGLPFRCWRAWICLIPSSWIRTNVSNSFIDSASKPAPYRGACRDISSWSEASRVWIYCCMRKRETHQSSHCYSSVITHTHTEDSRAIRFMVSSQNFIGFFNNMIMILTLSHIAIKFNILSRRASDTTSALSYLLILLF